MNFFRNLFGKKPYDTQKSNTITPLQQPPSVDTQIPAPSEDNMLVKEFYVAIDKNNFEKITEILQKFPLIVNSVVDRGRTPLHYSVMGNDNEVVTKKIELFLSCGADINVADEEGNTPLYCAVDWNWENNAVDMLIAAGASINKANKEENTPLHAACFRENIKAAKTLLSCNDLDVNSRQKVGITPLMNAAEHGMIEIVELLLKKGADINAKTAKNETPLHYAAAGGNVEIAKILLAHGADLHAKTTDGCNALEVAGLSGYAKAYSFFHDEGLRPPYE